MDCTGSLTGATARRSVGALLTRPPHLQRMERLAQNATSAIRMPLPDGDAGTAKTISVVRRLVNQAVSDPEINQLALSIVRNVPGYDFTGEARAIFDWVRRNIQFRRDPARRETLRTAQEILRVSAGDCDCINGVLLPALLESIGQRVRLVTVATDPEAPREFTHIYPEVLLDREWIPIDAATRMPAFGVGPARFFRKRVWDLGSAAYRDLAGLGDLWSSLTTALPSLAQTGVSIAQAVNQPSGYPMPTLTTPSGQVVSSNPQLVPAAAASSSSTLWIVGGAAAGLLVLAMLFGGRR